MQAAAIDAELGANWTIAGNTIRLNHGVGVNAGSGSTVVGNRLVRNGQAGYAAGGDDFRFEGNEIANNNYAGVDSFWEAGGGKTTETAGGVFRGNCVHDNDGPGIRMDIDADNVLVEDNVVCGNSDNGIMYEISRDGIIRNNTVADNGDRTFRRKGWFWALQILVSSSRGVEVSGNTVDVPADFGNAITIVSQDRPLLTPAVDNEVSENTITIRGTAGGRLGAVTDVRADVATVANRNRMHDNAYHLASLTETSWSWHDDDLDWSGIRAAGQESGSTADTSLPAKPALSCDFLGPAGARG